MKLISSKRLSAVLSLSALALVGVGQAQINPGNLLLMRIGDGSTALADGTGAAIDILEISTNRTAAGTSIVNTFSLPSTGTGAITSTGIDTSFGTSPSEGQITISGNGSFAVFTGYNAPAEPAR